MPSLVMNRTPHIETVTILCKSQATYFFRMLQHRYKNSDVLHAIYVKNRENTTPTLYIIFL